MSAQICSSRLEQMQQEQHKERAQKAAAVQQGKMPICLSWNVAASWIWPTPGEGSLGYMWDSPKVLDDGTSMKGCRTGYKMLFQGYLCILCALRGSGAGDAEHLLTESSGFSTAREIHILLLISLWIPAVLPHSCNPCQYPAEVRNCHFLCINTVLHSLHQHTQVTPSLVLLLHVFVQCDLF